MAYKIYNKNTLYRIAGWSIPTAALDIQRCLVSQGGTFNLSNGDTLTIGDDYRSEFYILLSSGNWFSSVLIYPRQRGTGYGFQSGCGSFYDGAECFEPGTILRIWDFGGDAYEDWDSAYPCTYSNEAYLASHDVARLVATLQIDSSGQYWELIPNGLKQQTLQFSNGYAVTIFTDCFLAQYNVGTEVYDNEGDECLTTYTRNGNSYSESSTPACRMLAQNGDRMTIFRRDGGSITVEYWNGSWDVL